MPLPILKETIKKKPPIVPPPKFPIEKGIPETLEEKVIAETASPLEVIRWYEGGIMGGMRIPEGMSVQKAINLYEKARIDIGEYERGLPPVTPPVPPTEPPIEPTAPPEFTVEAVYPLMQKIFPEFTGALEYPYPPKEEIPQRAVEWLVNLANENPDEFFRKILEYGDTPETEQLLAMFGTSYGEIFAPSLRWEKMVTDVYPTMTIDEFSMYLETDPMGFIDDMQTGGQTKEKLDLLHRGLGIPFQSETELSIQDIFSQIKIVVPIEGVRQLVTVNQYGKAMDEEGHWVGTYNPASKEFTAANTDEGFIKDSILDPLWAGTADMIFRAKQFWAGVVPNILYPDLAPGGYPEPLRNWINETNKQMRDGFRKVYAINQDEHERWQAKNPQFAPKPEWEEGWSEHPGLILNPAYLAYEFSSTAPVTLSVMATIMGTQLLTGNPLLAMWAGMSLMVPVEAADSYEALLAAGAPEDMASPMALVVGTFAGAIESLSDLFVLKIISPSAALLLKRGIISQAAKATVAHAIKKGWLTFTYIEAIEIVEEVLTQVANNAALKFYDENRGIWDDVVKVAAKTFAATLPIAAVGGATTMVATTQHRGMSLEEVAAKIKDEGWKLDPSTGKMFRPMTSEEIKVKLEDAGVVEKVAVPEVMPEVPVIPEVTIPKTAEEVAALVEEGRLVKATEKEVDAILRETLTPDIYEEHQRLLRTEAAPVQISAFFDKEATALFTRGWVYNREETAWYKPTKPPAVKPAEPVKVRVTATSDGTGLFVREDVTGWTLNRNPDGSLRVNEHGMVLITSPDGRNLYVSERDAKILSLQEVKPAVVTPEVRVAEVVELPAAKEGITGLPPPTEPVTPGVAENTQGIAEITAKEEVRPARKVFTKMGIWRDFYKPMQKAEVLVNEEKQAYAKERKVTNKLLSKDAERRALVFRATDKGSSLAGLTFNEKRAVGRIREWANRWADRKNLPESKRRKFYITHLFEEEMIREIKEENGIDPVLARILDKKFAGKITDPFLKKRLGKEMGLLEDPIVAMEAYDNASIRVIHYAPLLNKINAYMADLNIPEGSREYLRNYARRMTGELSKADIALNKMMEEFAGALRKVPVLGERLSPYLTTGNPAGMAAYNLTGALYALWLGYKPTSAIRNLSQHSLIMAEVGPVHFAEALSKTATAESNAAFKESMVRRGRKMAFLPGLEDSLLAKGTRTFINAALILFRGADWVNVRHAFLAGYYEAKAKMPHATRQELIDRGDEVAADTQYQYTKMNSMAFAQNSPGRVMSMLTTWTENWMELLAKWVKKTPSQVYLEYEARTGEKVAGANWSTSYKAILLYMTIVGLGYLVKEKTRLKAWEYTGITSIEYAADIIGGDFPALQAPGGVADTIVGFLTQDERRLNEGLYKLKSTFTPAILRQLDSVAKGDKDWLTIFFYLEGKDINIKRLKNKWKKELDQYPIFETPKDKDKYLKAHPEQGTWSDDKIRNWWREQNPLAEAKLFVVSAIKTLSTDGARTEALRLIEEHKIDTGLIDGYEKVFGRDTNEILNPFKKRIGAAEVLEIGKEVEYFSMGDFASEVNNLVKSMGRAKVEQDGHPLAVAILHVQDTFVPYEILDAETGGRLLWRQQFPEGEAWLYLLGKVTAFENPKSAEILLGLMEKFDIPPQAIYAFGEDPAKYDELFTQKFELQKKWFGLNTEYENYGNAESDIYIEDKEERKLTRDKLKDDNPNWVADLRRIEAIDNDAPDEIIDKWAERGNVVDEYTAGSSEAKVWLLDNPETHKWALDNKLLEDDGSDWDEPVLRLNVEMRGLDEESDEYALLSRKKEAYTAGFPEGQIDNYVAYYDLPVAGRRQERFLVGNPEFAELMHNIKGLEIPKPQDVLPVEYDILLEKEDKTPEDEMRLTAYEKKVPQKHIDNYVSYYSIGKPKNWVTKNKTDLWYEDDWFMMEHPEFYKEVYLGISGNERKDYRTVPTRAVFEKYLEYVWEAKGKPREDYRLLNLDLDAWLVIKFDLVPITEKKRREELTPAEKLAEEIMLEEEKRAKARAETEEGLGELD